MNPALIDLTHLSHEIRAGRRGARAALESSTEAASTALADRAFVRRFDESAMAQATLIDAMRRDGRPVPPLAGLAVSVKDLFDVAGHPTTAASKSLRDAPAALRDAPAVARLRSAGAALIGHTNLTEFAFSGVGINPHFGTPANAATVEHSAEERIPGGSTSGGATSVAAGAAWAALGTDTGGSIRIPAALQGLVGFKSTAGQVPTEGCIPLSTSLDTACAITRSVRDACLLHEVLSARATRPLHMSLRELRIACPQRVMLDGLEPSVSQAFEHSLSALRGAGMRIDDIELPQLAEGIALQRGGGLVAAEAWAFHQSRLVDREADYDPRVAARIRRGAALSEDEVASIRQERDAWISKMHYAMAPYDAMLSPTVPIVAPKLAPLLRDDESFFSVNAQLLRNPSLVNLLNGCAISLPCHPSGEWPVGLMIWAPGMHDDHVLGIARLVEEILLAPRGLC